jgi:hypothetical protein
VGPIHSHPVYAGEMQGKVLGMAVGIFDEAGKDISETGVAGELVCTRPHPSIPVRFWGDDAHGGKFLKAYYDKYPGVWCHGDFIVMNPHTKGYIIHGRRSALPSCMRPHAHACLQRRSVEPLGCALWFGRDIRRARALRVFGTHRRRDMRWPATPAGQRRACAAVRQDACGT